MPASLHPTTHSGLDPRFWPDNSSQDTLQASKDLAYILFLIIFQ